MNKRKQIQTFKELIKSLSDNNITPQVTILASDLNEFQEAIIKRYKSTLESQIGCKLNISLKTSGEMNVEKLTRLAKEIISSGSHMIFTIGYTATTGAQRATQEIAPNFPVLFCGVAHPQKHDFIHSYNDSGNNLVGISIESPCRILPIQLLHKLNPKDKTFIVPFRKDACKEAFFDEMQEAQRLFRQKGKEIILYEIESEYLPQKILEEVSQYDALAVPEGMLSKQQQDALIEACVAKGMNTYGDGKDAIQKGAVFAITSDLQHVARKAASYTIKILLKGMHPRELETIKLTQARSLAHGSRGASRSGVSCASELLAIFEHAAHLNTELEPYLRFFKDNSAGSLHNTAAGMSVIKYLTKKEDCKTTWLSDEVMQQNNIIIPKEFKDLSRTQKQAHALVCYGKKEIFSSGKELSLEVVEWMNKKNEQRVLNSTIFDESIDSADKLAVELPGTSFHKINVISKPLPFAPLIALKNHTKKRLSTTHLIITIPKHSLPEGHDEYIKQIRSEAIRLKCPGFKTVICLTAKEIELYVKDNSFKEHAFFMLPHLTNTQLIKPFIEACFTHKRMFVCPSNDYKEMAPITLAFNPKVLNQNPTETKTLNEQTSVQFFNIHTAYRLTYNPKLIIALGGVFNKERAEYEALVDSTIDSDDDDDE